ncbi:hypothetical protein PN36_32870 [Candidatus Thiomargarita nelsonii]|uniref:Uncharacterized protein n=1 Tax=Candidatus Thiomargarita nelsonii TaxID=1003181 RepID=A0A4E0QRC6_9GAMM|nr:hypothetical protein PN36_32870 [Candidatus Thiomargarita nelsonii]
MKRVALIIPDAGPLISLGKAKSLDILLKLELPIYIIDQVYFEVTREIIETQVGRLARMEREINPSARQRQLGDAAITDFLTNQVNEFVESSQPVLLLFEDSDLIRMNVVLRENVHMLSTKALLIGMERLGLITSEVNVWENIIAAGRIPSNEIVDQSAPAVLGGSYWQP